MATAQIPETLRHLVVPIDTLRPHPQNPNNGDLEKIAESLRVHGQYVPIVYNVRRDAQSYGCIIKGNHTYAAAMELGWTEIAATTVDKDDTEAIAIMVADNRLSDLHRPDEAMLAALLADMPTLEGTGYDQQAMDELLERILYAEAAPLDAGQGAPPLEPYTRRIEAPLYAPRDTCPSVAELYDDRRTRELVAAIDVAADLSDEQRHFLRLAAQRHTVLHFNRIADYYAHAAVLLQALMEDSALVIIDFRRAIELGFAQMTQEIAAQARDEYGDD